MDETEDIELTADEEQSAIDAAKLLKANQLKAAQNQLEAAKAAEVDKAEQERLAAEAKAEGERQAEARKAHPQQHVGLLLEGATEPDYRVNPSGDLLERRHLLDGANWEHVSEDAAGVWLYRRM